MTNAGMTLCAVFRVPLAGQPLFTAYEAEMLPLLPVHGGILQRRLRSEDGGTEIHLIWFPSKAHFDAFRADPRRSAHAHLFEGSGVTAEVITVHDVNPG